MKREQQKDDHGRINSTRRFDIKKNPEKNVFNEKR